MDTGSISDGYHTFNELYEHRHALVLALMPAAEPRMLWHGFLDFLPMRLWGLAELTGAAELERGRPWDGHTASDVVHRLKAWASRPSTQDERIVFRATSPDKERISHIELADSLIDAVVSELAPIYTSKEQ